MIRHTAPIFAIDPGDVLVFKDLESAESYLDPEDVENGVYELFDSKGLPLSATGHYNPRYVKIVVQNATPRADDLAKILKDFLSRIGEDPDWIKGANLAMLVSKLSRDYLTK